MKQVSKVLETIFLPSVLIIVLSLALIGPARPAEEELEKGYIPSFTGIYETIQGVMPKVSNCYSNAPCNELCPASTRQVPGVSSVAGGTYCFLGRCFCRSENIERPKACWIPKGTATCTLPTGISLTTLQPTGPSPSMVPYHVVCKLKSGRRNRKFKRYCVFFTDALDLGSNGLTPGAVPMPPMQNPPISGCSARL